MFYFERLQSSVDTNINTVITYKYHIYKFHIPELAREINKYYDVEEQLKIDKLSMPIPIMGGSYILI